MQDRIIIKKPTNIRSFIGCSVSLHLVIIGLLASSYFFSQKSISASQYNLENSVKIDLTQMSIPSLAASNDDPSKDNQVNEIESESIETETKRIANDKPIIEEPVIENKDQIVEQAPIETKSMSALIEKPITKSTSPVKTETKTEEKKVTKKKNVIKKSEPKDEEQTESSSSALNNNISSDNSNQKSQHAVLIKAVNPQYPKKALDMRIEGYVIVNYDINEAGETENISIVEAKPNNIFNRTVITAIRQWRYKPSSADNMTLRFVFNHKQNQIQYETAKL